MPILFTVVSRAVTVLSQYASCGGNFSEVTAQILPKITLDNHNMTLSHDDYMFHYICENRIIFLCLTDDEFARSRAFAFLSDMKRRFLSQYGNYVNTALAYSMNSEFSKIMESLVSHYNSDNWNSRVHDMKNDVVELTHIRVRNIDELGANNERLKLLVDMSEEGTVGSLQFRTTVRHTQRHFCKRNIWPIVIICFLLLTLVYLVVSLGCGGFSWPCTRH